MIWCFLKETSDFPSLPFFLLWWRLHLSVCLQTWLSGASTPFNQTHFCDYIRLHIPERVRERWKEEAERVLWISTPPSATVSADKVNHTHIRDELGSPLRKHFQLVSFGLSLSFLPTKKWKLCHRFTHPHVLFFRRTQKEIFKADCTSFSFPYNECEWRTQLLSVIFRD